MDGRSKDDGVGGVETYTCEAMAHDKSTAAELEAGQARLEQMRANAVADDRTADAVRTGGPAPASAPPTFRSVGMSSQQQLAVEVRQECAASHEARPASLRA